MDDEILELMWSNHSSIFKNLLNEHRLKEKYTDVTIGCEGKLYSVHKLVLATCSKYFEDVFEHTEGKHPVLLLHDVKRQELEALLCYMYAGSATVTQQNLARFVKVAEALQIKGLAVPDEECYNSIAGEEDSVNEYDRRSSLTTEDDAGMTRMQYQTDNDLVALSLGERPELEENICFKDGERIDAAFQRREMGAQSSNRNSFQGFNCQNIKTSVDVDVKKRKILEKIVLTKEDEQMEMDKECPSQLVTQVEGNTPKQVYGEGKTIVSLHDSSDSFKASTRRSIYDENKPGIRRLKATNPASVKLYKCSKCTFRSDYKGIKKHFVTHSISKSLKCPHCFSSFASKFTLHRHMKKHSQTQDHACIYCHAKFPSKEFLSNHLETHDKTKPYCCTFCKASFSRKDKLTVHLKKHEAEAKVLITPKNKSNAHSKSISKAFICKECPATFKNHSQYLEHANMHASERQFPCSVCPAAFAKKVHLSRHVLSHKGFGSRDKLQDVN
ncbi:hypothetical protein SK128_006854 [Halocaridina rubra]|uniref:Uncharacterized protein n=1 Tax=Halocaridina rubra TaxID=373956 RepID=A0AAN8WMU3_HALRR